MTRIDECPICAWRYFGCALTATINAAYVWQIVEADAGHPLRLAGAAAATGYNAARPGA